MRSCVCLFLALFTAPLVGAAQFRTTGATDVDNGGIELQETPGLEEISRLFPNGGGTSYIELLRGIRQGKDGFSGCIQLVDRKSAQAFLVAVDKETEVWTFSCPITPCSGYARKKIVRTQREMIMSFGGQVLWRGEKENFLQQSLLKQLTKALKCDDRPRVDADSP